MTGDPSQLVPLYDKRLGRWLGDERVGTSHMCDRCVLSSIQNWDNHISMWLRNSEHDLGAHALLDASGKPKSLQLEALPEPYVGDPRDPGVAVMINLNPGKEDQAQKQGGAFHSEVQKAGYYSAVRLWKVAGDTTKWWRGRSCWVARFLRLPEPQSPPRIYGLDIFPWHSESWGGMNWNALNQAWVTTNVFAPAGSAAAKTVLGVELIKRGLRPAVIAVGNDVKKSIERKIVQSKSERSDGRGWPVGNNGDPVKRKFILHHLRIPDQNGGHIDFDLLVTWAPGSNKPPSVKFDPIVREMLRLT